MPTVHAVDLAVDLGQSPQPLGLFPHPLYRFAVVVGDGREQRSEHPVVRGEPALGDFRRPREPQPLRREKGATLLAQLPQPDLAFGGVGNQRRSDHQGTAEGPIGDGGPRLREPLREPGRQHLELSACRVVASDQRGTQQCGQQEEVTALRVLARVSAVLLKQVCRQPGGLTVTGGEQRGGTGQAECHHLRLGVANGPRQMMG